MSEQTSLHITQYLFGPSYASRRISPNKTHTLTHTGRRTELTQMDSVRLVSVCSALLDQGGKGHRQDVFTLPRTLASSGYLGQLQKETKPQLHLQNTGKMRRTEAKDRASPILPPSTLNFSHTTTMTAMVPFLNNLLRLQYKVYPSYHQNVRRQRSGGSGRNK